MAVATPVAITSISRTSNVVTVNATAHGLVAGQGFSVQGVTLDGTFNINATVATATANAITFAQTGANNSIGTGGTLGPAKEVIVLGVNYNPPELRVFYVFWVTTSAGVPNPNFTSALTSASAQEVAALRTGTTIEVSSSQIYPSTFSKSQIQTDLQSRWSAYQANIAAGVQPGQFYGGYFDGVGWSF